MVALPSRRLARGRVARARPGPRWPRDSRHLPALLSKAYLVSESWSTSPALLNVTWSCERAHAF